MIITLMGANFTNCNIGTLTTWNIRRSLGSGATSSSSVTTVERDASWTETITLADGYTFGTYSITMGSTTITPTVTGNTLTFTISAVTGNINITVATINESTGEEDGGDTGGDTTYTYSSIPTSYMKEGYLVSGSNVQPGSGFFTIENIPVTPGYLYSSPKVRNFMYKKSDGTVIYSGGFGGKDATMSFGKNVSTFTACYKYDDIQPSDANLIAIEPEAFGTGDTKTVDGLTLTMYGNSTSSATSPYYGSNSDYNYFVIIYDNVQPNVTYSAPFARNASVVGTEVTTLALGGASNATITTGADTTQIVITYRREDLEPAEALITIQN